MPGKKLKAYLITHNIKLEFPGHSEDDRDWLLMATIGTMDMRGKLVSLTDLQQIAADNPAHFMLKEGMLFYKYSPM